jgi:hypothetical protein
MRANPVGLSPFVLLALAMGGGCLSSSSPSQDLCSGGTGSVDCECFPNSTCNTGLVCYSKVCVAVPEAGAPAPASGTATGTTPAGDASTGSAPAESTGEGGTSGSDGNGDAPVMASAEDDGATPPAGTNLVTNGSFSQGTMFWGIVSGNGTANANNGQLCVMVAANQNAILGWPEPSGTAGPPLVPGAMYTLQYSAQATPSTGVDVKVGHTTSPYTADFETPMGGDAVPGSSMTFTHTFNAPTSPAESSAGLAFTVPATGTAPAALQVCFQNVSLVQN